MVQASPPTPGEPEGQCFEGPPQHTSRWLSNEMKTNTEMPRDGRARLGS